MQTYVYTRGYQKRWRLAFHLQGRGSAVTKLAEAGSARRAPGVKLTPEFGRNVMLLVQAGKFISSYAA